MGSTAQRAEHGGAGSIRYLKAPVVRADPAGGCVFDEVLDSQVPFRRHGPETAGDFVPSGNADELYVYSGNANTKP